MHNSHSCKKHFIEGVLTLIDVRKVWGGPSSQLPNKSRILQPKVDLDLESLSKRDVRKSEDGKENSRITFSSGTSGSGKYSKRYPRCTSR